jgi:hypothetical protein
MEALESVQVSARKVPPRPVNRLKFLTRNKLKQHEVDLPIHEYDVFKTETLNSASFNENFEVQILNATTCKKKQGASKGPGRRRENFKPALISKRTLPESQEKIRISSSKENISNSRRHRKQYTELPCQITEQRMDNSTPRSSWKEEQRNEELQARFFAGIPSPLDPSFKMKDLYLRSSYFQSITVTSKPECRERSSNKALRSSRQQEIRDPPEPTKVKAFLVAPSVEELEQIKALVETVVMNGMIKASDESAAATRINSIVREEGKECYNFSFIERLGLSKRSGEGLFHVERQKLL